MTSGIGERRAAARDEGGAAYQERRTEIVRAAAEMFKRNGYRGTKLNDVAEAMNLAYGIIGMVAWSNRWFNPNESSVPAEEIGDAYAETLLRGLQV